MSRKVSRTQNVNSTTRCERLCGGDVDTGNCFFSLKDLEYEHEPVRRRLGFRARTGCECQIC